MRILIAVDDSVESRDATRTAFEFFGPNHDYSILSVGRREPIYLSGYPAGGFASAAAIDDAISAAEANADAAASAAEEVLPVQAETSLEMGPPGELICAKAAESNSDLIVIGSHDRNFLQRLLDPDVGRHVVDNAPCPVLVVR